MPRDYFYELSARQIKIGHRVDVVTWKKNGGLSEMEMPEGFVAHRLPGLNLSAETVVQDYPYIPSLPSTIEILNPEVVHVESHLFLTAVQAVRKARELKIPCVITVHGIFAERGKAVNLVQSMYLHSIGLKILREADSVICLTRSDAEEIEKLGVNSDQIKFVPNAVDTRIFTPSANREDNLVVWVGRFVHEKGLEYLIDAAKMVIQEKRDVRFLLIGYGPLKNKIMKMAYDLGLLGKSMNIIGPLDRFEIAKVLNRSTIFVFPSLKEGMPLALLEAMASGNAVVASNIRGINELVKDHDNGLLFRARNPIELAYSIQILLDDRNLRKKLSDRARNAVREKNSWSNVLAKLDSVYKLAMVN